VSERKGLWVSLPTGEGGPDEREVRSAIAHAREELDATGAMEGDQPAETAERLAKGWRTEDPEDLSGVARQLWLRNRQAAAAKLSGTKPHSPRGFPGGGATRPCCA